MSLEQLLERRNTTELSFDTVITGINNIGSRVKKASHQWICDCDCNCECDDGPCGGQCNCGLDDCYT